MHATIELGVASRKAGVRSQSKSRVLRDTRGSGLHLGDHARYLPFTLPSDCDDLEDSGSRWANINSCVCKVDTRENWCRLSLMGDQASACRIFLISRRDSLPKCCRNWTDHKARRVAKREKKIEFQKIYRNNFFGISRYRIHTPKKQLQTYSPYLHTKLALGAPPVLEC